MSANRTPELKNAVLLIADISGYSQFVIMKKVSLIHSEEIITELLEAVTETAAFPLRLDKIEGDAVFLCADAGDNRKAAVNDVAAQATRFMRAFADKQAFLIEHGDGGCPCSACRSVGELGLKILIHADEVIIKSIAGRQELAGEGIILVHRLLKNTVNGSDYILMPKTIADLVTIDPLPHRESHSEQVADFGPVDVVVYSAEPTEKPRPKSRPLTRLRGIREAMRLFKAHRKRNKSPA